MRKKIKRKKNVRKNMHRRKPTMPKNKKKSIGPSKMRPIGQNMMNFEGKKNRMKRNLHSGKI